MLVEIEVARGIGVITLNRPERRNALSGEVMALLEEAVVTLDTRDDVGCMILTGADPAFCAGVDLQALSSELASLQPDAPLVPVATRGLVPEHETPMIGAINGPTVTGGLELALSCDFLVASERARFADTHARVGVMPGAGLTVRLPRLIGIDRARRMSYTGDFIDAETALHWGLVVEVVRHEVLLERARALATAVVGMARDNIRGMRRMYEEIGELAGRGAWAQESHVAREWIDSRFDRARLAAE
jgi:enoyl-CoA hydratase